jgi:hypothetical protein
MSAVTEVQGDVLYSTRCVEKCEKDLKAARATLAERTKKLQDLLAAGGTTGDRLQDLVIQAFGVDDALTALYRSLEERLKGKNGEFVLVRYPAEVRMRFGGDIRSSDFNQETHFRIGILAGETLQMGNRRFGGATVIGLPIQRFLIGQWPESFGRKAVVDDGMFEGGDLFDWRAPEDQPPQLLQYLQEEYLAKDLLIGDDAVKQALAEAHSEQFFAQAAERLGRLILQPTS